MQSVNAIKSSRLGVQTFRFGQDLVKVRRRFQSWSFGLQRRNLP